MKITVTTPDEQILTLGVNPHESVEKLKALLEIESQVPLLQQQLLYNGEEMRNAETLSGLGVSDGDMVMMVSNAASSTSRFSTMSQKSQSPSGSSTDHVECEFLVMNIRYSTSANTLHSYFGEYGRVMAGKYLHVHPFTLENHHSVLTFTRAYVVTLNLSDEKKDQILGGRHIIDDLKVSVKEFKGESHHMKELNGFDFDHHFLLQSFTNLRDEPHVISLIEDLFDGLNCRIRLLQTDIDADRASATAVDQNEEDDDPFQFMGNAVISFFSENECHKAKQIAHRFFQGCRISEW